MKKPNLFVIGAAKSGTTTLHNLLAQHPAIFMSTPKEIGFFSKIGNKKLKQGLERWRIDLEEYLRLFETGKSLVYAGESSTGYSQLPYRPGVAKRIYEFNGKARIIYIIREPIARTISHYWWNVRWEDEVRDIEEAIINDTYYRNISYYAMQIKPYIDLFGIAQIKVFTLEEFKKDMQYHMWDIFKWLGIDTKYTSKLYFVHNNKTPIIIERPRYAFIDKLRYSFFWERIGPFFPSVVRKSVKSLLVRKINRNYYDLKEIEDFLRPIFKEQIEELSDLLGRDFPEWGY